MNERTMIDFFALQNEWWYDKTIFLKSRVKKFKRRDYYYLFNNEVSTTDALVIIGPRGVGKSTVLHEIIRELLVECPINKLNN